MSDTLDLFMVCLQVDGTGNCMFSAIKKSLLVHAATSQEATYFPNHYGGQLHCKPLAVDLQQQVPYLDVSLWH